MALVSLAALAVALPAALAFACTENWPDVCPPPPYSGSPQSRANPACDDYAPPLPPGDDLLARRAQLINVLFGRADGLLPNATAPDFVVASNASDTFTSRGCWCSTLGNCAASACAWSNNKTALVFTVRAPLGNGTDVVLNSTAFWTRNTSGVAPSSYIGPLGPPKFPSVPMPATGLSNTLVIFHQGHNSPCDIPEGDPDYDGVIDFLNQIGYDTINLHMPLYQVNAAGFFDCDHSAFAALELLGAPVFRFFLEPIVRAVNFAVSVGYSRIVLAGLSGGGWSTVLGAAIDPRIALSVPIAGSMPCDFAHTSWDFEQLCTNAWAQVANYSTLYALASLEPGRVSVQVLHEQDPCCFHGCGRHDRIRAYNAWVANVTRGLFRTSVHSGNVHEVNPRDRVVLAMLLDKLRIAGALTAADLDSLPFNTLREW